MWEGNDVLVVDKLLELKKWIDEHYPNFNKSDIEDKIDELIKR